MLGDFFMKKYYYFVVIVLLGIFCVKLTDYMICSSYYIKENLVESMEFRNFQIKNTVLKEAKKIAKNKNYDFAKVLTINYLANHNNLKKLEFKDRKIKQQEKTYIQFCNIEYEKLYKGFAAVFNDLKYFPVAKGKSDDYWVGYDNSFGADRNFNGSYKHEGCDIMAERNVSGYYPIISVTDGVIENIGWLPKGGYRVGIRSNNGGYFYYAHLSSYTNIKKGDSIKAGTLLGYMGDTGYGEEGTKGKFDVHLHFGIYITTENYDELSVNPYYILKYLEDNVLYADY